MTFGVGLATVVAESTAYQQVLERIVSDVN